MKTMEKIIILLLINIIISSSISLQSLLSSIKSSNIDRRLYDNIKNSVLSSSSISSSSSSSSSLKHNPKYKVSRKLYDKRRKLMLPVVTNWATRRCEKWIKFDLRDFNPNSGRSFLLSYGLDDRRPAADVTIVGLYFADRGQDIETIQVQERLGAELEEMGITVQNAALNYYAPYSCAIEECVGMYSDFNWQNSWLFPWYEQKNCEHYVGGCAPEDSRLSMTAWQMHLANVSTMPIFQDTEYDDVWENMGGGEGDIFIYDAEGRLYAYICAQSYCDEDEAIYGNLLNATDYSFIKSQAIEAAQSNGTERCYGFEDDDLDYFYYTDDDSYYAYIDDAYFYQTDDNNDDDDDDDDDDDRFYFYNSTVVASADGVSSTDDTKKDDYYYYDDIDDDDDDDISNRRRRIRWRKIPSYVYFFVLIACSSVIGIGAYARIRSIQNNNNEIKFVHLTGGRGAQYSKLSTLDSDSMEVEMRHPTGQPNPRDDWTKSELGYGSL